MYKYLLQWLCLGGSFGELGQGRNTAAVTKNAGSSIINLNFHMILFSDIETLSLKSKRYLPAVKSLCGNKISDLLLYLPTALVHRTIIDNIYKAQIGDNIVIQDSVHKHIAPFSTKQPYTILGESGLNIKLFQYKAGYIKKYLDIGSKISVAGKISSIATIIHPDYIKLGHQDIPLIEAIYPLSQRTGKFFFNNLMQKALKKIPTLKEWIPSNVLDLYDWDSWKNSMITIHNPENINKFNKAMERLAYDEILVHYFIASKIKQSSSGISIKGDGNLRNSFIKTLGYNLTNGQYNSLNEIYKDQYEKKRMFRILQGDVGSGKTLVAILSMLNTVEAGYQAAFMVPTDLLAMQHYDWIKNNIKINIELLIRKKKQTSLENIKTGAAMIVIGTHALFQEKVHFKSLGLVVIDEQHKFGVTQRAQLAEKGRDTDVLLMTATPIPRTLNMTIYRNMDISIIPDKPQGRKDIITSIIVHSKIDILIQRIEKKQGKTFWVCPLVEESEHLDLVSAKQRFEYVLKKVDSNNKKILLAHGKMTSSERKSVFNQFKEFHNAILITTTIVEVGIDIPEADLVIIENAERFGLAQLHQIRGRVGRGDKQSFCILILGKYTKHNSIIRLKVLQQYQDGFKIAEEDLKSRGSGEFIGTKQSGWARFIFFNIYKHQHILQYARLHAEELTSQNNIGDLEVFMRTLGKSIATPAIQLFS